MEIQKNNVNLFAAKELKDHKWAFNIIINFLQFQKEGIEREEITARTLRNFVKMQLLQINFADLAPC